MAFLKNLLADCKRFRNEARRGRIAVGESMCDERERGKLHDAILTADAERNTMKCELHRTKVELDAARRSLHHYQNVVRDERRLRSALEAQVQDAEDRIGELEKDGESA